MPRNLSNFENAEYGDVPFTPYVPPKRRGSLDLDFYADREPNYLLRAIAGGLAGAMVGAIVFAIFVGVTGWTIGYLAVLAGYLVGRGMMIGSDNHGGEEYQFTAVVITYLSVAVAQVIILLWFVRAGTPVVLNARSLAILAKYGLLYPFLELFSSPGSGVIDLIILFVGLRAAWRMTSETPGAKRSPFRR